MASVLSGTIEADDEHVQTAKPTRQPEVLVPGTAANGIRGVEEGGIVSLPPSSLTVVGDPATIVPSSSIGSSVPVPLRSYRCIRPVRDL